MARVKTFTNGGSLLPGDLNSIEDDYEFAFSTFKTLTRAAKTHNGTASGKYWYGHAQGSGVADAGADFGLGPSGMPPRAGVGVVNADLTANTRANKLRLKVTYITNQVAPALTFTWALTALTVSYGTSGNASGFTFGSDVPSSPLAVATPAASSGPTTVTQEFTAPADGVFALTANLSAGMAAGAVLNVIVELQQRQV